MLRRSVVCIIAAAAFFATANSPSTAQDKTDVPKINSCKPPGPAPKGMVWIPGGWFWMGDDKGPYDDTRPIHKVYVDGFWMDKTEVTNEQWAKFVKATGYKTVAERKPRLEDFAEVLKEAKNKKMRDQILEDLKHPFSIVFKVPKPGQFDLNNHFGWWVLKRGASWKRPTGPKSTIKGLEKHPVVHICYEDAVAYCKWAKKRLPTEAEWEFAARGGLDRKKYCWGDELLPKGKWMANIWQGKFPIENRIADGYFFTAPVGWYPPNGYGLCDMAGNVWEWCSDWYDSKYYKKSPRKNPKGSKIRPNPRNPGMPKRVQRGGSFLCADNYCKRYLPGARGKGEPTSAQSHCGFRCVMDAK